MAEVSPVDDERRKGARRREDDARWRNVAIGYLCLLLGLAAALYSIEKRDTHRGERAVIEARAVARAVAFAECQRVNLLRVQANATAETVFATLWSSAQREDSLATGPQRQTHLRSARVLELLARQSKHTALTDCHAAVFHPETYIAPVPVPFDPAKDRLIARIRRIR